MAAGQDIGSEGERARERWVHHSAGESRACMRIVFSSGSSGGSRRRRRAKSTEDAFQWYVPAVPASGQNVKEREKQK